MQNLEHFAAVQIFQFYSLSKSENEYYDNCEEKGEKRQDLLNPVSAKKEPKRKKKSWCQKQKVKNMKKPENSSRKPKIPTGRPLGSPHVKILPEMVGVDMKRQNLSANTNTDKFKYNERQ